MLLTGLGVDEYFTRTDSSGTANFLTDALGSTPGAPGLDFGIFGCPTLGFGAWGFWGASRRESAHSVHGIDGDQHFSAGSEMSRCTCSGITT